MKKFILAIVGVIALWFWGLYTLANNETELKFSHKMHVQENELECTTCHPKAETSATGMDNLMPAMNVCADCHDVQDSENCGTCHSDLENPRRVSRIDRYSQKFSHEKHLNTGLDCLACHAAVVSKETAAAIILPSMGECLQCHETRAVLTECSSCHLPEENLRPVSHTPNFLHNHSDLARNNMIPGSRNLACTTCHKIDYCQTCHEGDNLDRQTHPLNFQFTHALEAQGKEKECGVCHTERSFCIDCHRENQLMPHNHVAGWVNRIPNDGGRHRVEAMNDLEACMACHEQNAEETCNTCHGK